MCASRPLIALTRAQPIEGTLLLTRSGPELQDITTQIDETSKFGLIISAEKTKMRVIEKRKEATLSIKIQGELIKKVTQVCLPTGGLINAAGSKEELNKLHKHLK